jgi:septal ring factor EnvC (AmiA/AmiB activator)
MNRVSKVLVVLVVAALGVWGCAQGPAQQNAGNPERLKGLEREVAKLQDDYHSVSAARDQVRKKLADVEEQRLRLQSELDQLQTATAKEREELKAQITARLSERDAALGQFDQFRRSVRTLLIQADAAAASLSSTPSLTLSEPPTSSEQTSN